MDQKGKSRQHQESSFPFRLYDALEQASELPELTIGWLPEGNGLTIHNRDAFMNFLNPQYFDLKIFKSFLKQLNLYGFTRVVMGVNKGAYVHKNLKRGQRLLCHLITRPKLYKSSKKEVKDRISMKKIVDSNASAILPSSMFLKFVQVDTTTTSATLQEKIRLFDTSAADCCFSLQKLRENIVNISCDCHNDSKCRSCAKAIEIKLQCSREDKDWQFEHAQNLFQFACAHSNPSVKDTESQSQDSVWNDNVDHDNLIDEIVRTFSKNGSLKNSLS